MPGLNGFEAAACIPRADTRCRNSDRDRARF